MRHSEVELIFSGAVITSITVYKATPSDTLLSGPEVFLIACGWAAFLIMSLSISPYELIILQMNIIITLFCTTWTILRMRSRNNEIEIQE